MNYFSIILSLVIILAGGLVFSETKNSHSKDSAKGAICFGPDFSKGILSHNIFIRVDSLDKVKFSDRYGTIGINDLDLNKKHRIRLYEKETQFSSFHIDFKKLNTNFVIIWKAAGSWRAEPVKGEICELN